MDWHIKWLVVLFSVLSISLPACAKKQSAEASAPSMFEKKKIAINNIVIDVEIAETPEQHNQGLMNRDKLPENQGMLFVFQSPEIRSFWMKNTFIDLSIGYFDKNKVLFQVLDMKGTSLVEKNFPSYVSSGPAQYALEMTKGWFQKQKIKPGDKFEWR